MNSELVWFKSSYSGTEAGDCVEVARAPHAIHIRDSKDAGGPHLTLALAAWATFVRHAGEVASSRG
ncbi:DUF397 domain-containing protein [Streptomyces sp. NPDC090442]|uniref:DUF397 domain-containing protein n=1 Tax=Streptomyces sp. NPDC090442 TaxID=3365962 RepID=UPI003830F133